MSLRTTQVVLACAACLLAANSLRADDELTPADLEKVKTVEAARIRVIEKVYGSVVAIYGNDRAGGGSGVLFSSQGFALTNFHVVAGAGEEGWAGLADGKLYRWKLYGVDQGGDVAIIRLSGHDQFPPAELGDSRTVRVGDWAMAMGNPFVLADDLRPTVTLGIVSAIQRFQPGEGGKNSLVYGNCIQVDSSINPGNSGGPLVNMRSQIVGINGRGSFEERGRVNVGVGYAISMEQIKNFIPDLLATKAAQHGTLDAVFTDRQDGVICSQLNLNSTAAKRGLELGDRLISFAGEKIRNANHYLNLVSTLPAKWPVEVVLEHSGKSKSLWLRLDALPYAAPKQPATPSRPMPKPEPKKEDKKDELPAANKSDKPNSADGKTPAEGDKPNPANPEEKKPAEKQPDGKSPAPTGKPAKKGVTPSEPGKIRNATLNRERAEDVLRQWQHTISRQSSGMQDIKSLRWVEQSTPAAGSAAATIAPITITTLPGGVAKSEAAETKDQPLVVRRALSALYAANPSAAFTKLTLEGSDFTQGQRAYVLRGELSDGAEVYLWFSLLGQAGEFETRLIKVAADNDDGLAYVLKSYSEDQGTQFDFPHEVVSVRGLSEAAATSFKISDVRVERGAVDGEKKSTESVEKPADAATDKK